MSYYSSRSHCLGEQSKLTLNISLSIKDDRLPILSKINKLRGVNNESLSSFLLEKCAVTYINSINENKCPPISAPLSEWKKFMSRMSKEERFEFSEHLNRLSLLERKEFLSRFE